MLSACSCSGEGNAAKPTPTPIAVLAQEYKNAADRVNEVLLPINNRLSADCKTIDPCRADFAQWSQAESSFLSALRDIKMPSSMQADRRALLDFERRRISLIDDAAHAALLDQINTDFNSLYAMGSQFEDAVVRMRLDLGLPAVPPIASTANQSA